MKKSGDSILRKGMRMKKDSRGRKRNYKAEYKRDHSSEKDKKDRASRNAARRKKGYPAGKDVHHRDGNPRNNSAGNLGVVSRGYNRGEGNRRRGES